MNIDYDEMYASGTKEHFDWVKKTALWKAEILCGLIDEEETKSILEIGTGRGDVLNACHSFEVRIGADVSSEALEQHHREYGTEKLVKIKPDAPLPFEDNEVDFVLLCDILEHVNNPNDLLREAARVGKNLLLKIPIEKALLVSLMQKIRGVKYGANHPSGHLHCWRLPDILRITDRAGLVIIRGGFVPTPLELTKKKTLIKTILFYCASLVDFITRGGWFTRCLIGGSFFALARKKP